MASRSYDVVVGWDLGGAHLKALALDGGGTPLLVRQLACPLWQGLAHLQRAVDAVLAELPASGVQLHAATMTGELVDLFRDRGEGVRTLVEELRARLAPRPLLVYAGGAGLLSADAALQVAGQVASANWLASASLCATRLAQGTLLDIGSTTTDLVLFAGGRVHNSGGNDHERLRNGELLYTGITRTPLMALAPRVPFAGQWVNVMAEHFATTADLYRLLETLPEHADLLPAPDGGEKSISGSARRVARMVGCDLDDAEPAAWRRLAAYLAEQQLAAILGACQRLWSRGVIADDAPLVGAGSGRFLIAELARRSRRPYLDFASWFAPSAAAAAAADCAPAAAVATLALAGARAR